jgi:predicted MPP superfamily phosphohydrolase
VVIVGDFVDDDTDRKDMIEACKALGDLDTPFGVFFVYGNHDNGYYRYRNFDSLELRAELEKNDVVILTDESVLLDDSLYLIGRRDRSDHGRVTADMLMEGLDKTKYSIVLDHQPNDYDAEAAAGADLVLSGHTHGGHVFPAGQIGLLMGANDALYGVSRRGNTSFVVSSGISGWAIPFKTGTFSEIVVIDLIKP